VKSVQVLECLPCFAFVGIGLYLLLTALVPSWREKGWNHWNIYNLNIPGFDPNSWLVALGFAKPWKPLKEGDFNEKTAVRLCLCVGAFLVLIGLAAIIRIAEPW
jgi:hypothetical protein